MAGDQHRIGGSIVDNRCEVFTQEAAVATLVGLTKGLFPVVFHVYPRD
jgi:hypothetical protein